MPNTILLKVQQFLEQVNNGTAVIDEHLVQQFGETCKDILRKKVTEPKKIKFTFRQSNAGRAYCQLWHEKNGTKAEPVGTFFSMQMLYGDIIEALAVAVLKAAKVNVQSEQLHVTSKDGVQGTYDVEIDNSIWDIKSCSDWSFEHKFKNGTFRSMLEDDSFGYVAQGIGYADAVGKPFGGWLAINKSTGEWCVLEAEYDARLKQEILDGVKVKLDKLQTNAPFERCFEAEDETYYGKTTGNKVLGKVCSYCRFKSSCWPDLQILPTICSKAKERRLQYYVSIDPKFAGTSSVEQPG